ncbi:hypothetical protein SAMN05216339_11052 [Nitrosomonas eutropha]|uniref:Uncharacterized protein n=1 Tax=Nitrosomonas eutropha TaxID=916 RepID=A0A1I7IRE7_9PROT|nr:hypothetical protein SAMN05216339_11052 [Nitrosomonas eutropha]
MFLLDGAFVDDIAYLRPWYTEKVLTISHDLPLKQAAYLIPLCEWFGLMLILTLVPFAPVQCQAWHGGGPLLIIIAVLASGADRGALSLLPAPWSQAQA